MKLSRIVVSLLCFVGFCAGLQAQDTLLFKGALSDTLTLQNATVTAKTRTQQLKEEAYSVNALNINEIVSTLNSVTTAVDRTSGIRIREEGGVGSDFDLSINGLSGNAIRYFLDGMPLDAKGSGITLANLPVNLIERVEIYKGVIPASFGSDALGGAINIVTNRRHRNYLDFSASAGSFHTAKTDLNAQYTLPRSGLIFRPVLSVNYSKNDYIMRDVKVRNEEHTAFVIKDLPRFHDDYRSLFGQLEAGVADRSWADAFFVSASPGKSTALRHITGIWRQDEGEVLVSGEPVWENPKIKASIAYIPDDIFWFASASTRDMMKFYKGIYPRFDESRYEALGEVFDFDENRPLRHLSKGMQKQADFRLCLAMRPELLVLDEPVDGLDPVMRRRMWSLIMEDVAENGTTVLVSSHNLRELEDVCDRVGILSHGKMLLQRSLTELQENILKVQLALPEGGELPEGLNIVHATSTGRLQTLILRGEREALSERLESLHPLFMDLLPLTLEEIFIYEIGGAESEIQDIIL